MNQIEKQIDRIIAGLKTCEPLQKVRFIREYGTNNVETPVRGLLCVVSITDTALLKDYLGGYVSSKLKGECYTANVELRVYAPATENGSGLSEIAGEILASLKKADSEKIITESSATAIAFDPDLNAIYRDVKFSVEFCLCEEV